MKRVVLKSGVKTAAGIVLLLALTGCNTISNFLNPFYEPPGPNAYLGERSDRALNDVSKKEDTARKALETMGSYQAAHAPQPQAPVVQPAVFRLMWIPDHLNKTGDLVPAHYYYLKVLGDRPAVTDAFELEAQLNATTRGGAGNYPYVYGEQR